MARTGCPGVIGGVSVRAAQCTARVVQYQVHFIHNRGISSSGSPIRLSDTLDIIGILGAFFVSAGALLVTHSVPSGSPNIRQAVSLVVIPYSSFQSFQAG